MTEYEQFEVHKDVKTGQPSGTRVALPQSGGFMRYILAWALGVPGIVVIIWFLMSHH